MDFWLERMYEERERQRLQDTLEWMERRDPALSIPQQGAQQRQTENAFKSLRQYVERLRNMDKYGTLGEDV